MFRLLEKHVARPVYNWGEKQVGTYRIKRAVKQKLDSQSPCKLVIGASRISQHGWIPTAMETLNVLKPGDWKRYFTPDQVDAILAEHVWEHLTMEEGIFAAKMCFEYLKPGGYIRVAVPDGLHPDPVYIDHAKVGGCDSRQVTGEYGQDEAGHKVLYTYQTLTEVLESGGFRVELLEYFDNKGEFHCSEWHIADGMIFRSKRHDHRNRDGALNYTSIIIDAWKESAG